MRVAAGIVPAVGRLPLRPAEQHPRLRGERVGFLGIKRCIAVAWRQRHRLTDCALPKTDRPSRSTHTPLGPRGTQVRLMPSLSRRQHDEAPHGSHLCTSCCSPPYRLLSSVPRRGLGPFLPTRASDFQAALLVHVGPSLAAEQARRRVWMRDMSTAVRAILQPLLAVR